ncbi:SagB/ThcOx family dehydrogenase [Desulfobulbus alkaliphilus]|uniref:SagB/ThcOx family dehydrogenase n=1 Tax=Desulfobulbus alkaliphilus TaxID=869814 RepID=UPI0019642316|nr:SagB/ThcOx family dehydrogenase [Desulfobulbus alkaliphilus]MBM9535614.1 SagB/ThcOx family dehydrogenase [Desulfobulbus alkaliphilus]
MHRFFSQLVSTIPWRQSSGLLVFAILLFASGGKAMSLDQQQPLIPLPAPVVDGSVSLEQTLLQRRSLRDFDDEPLTLSQVAQLLWAAQGVTHTRGFRTAPSAGALYPLDTYLIAGKVTDLEPGVYLYVPQSHALIEKASGDIRPQLSRAALGQLPVRDAPATILFTAVYDRITGRYGPRGEQYAHIEAGHTAQNITLQAVALGLGSVVIGAFQDDLVRQVIELESGSTPLYLIPVGR